MKQLKRHSGEGYCSYSPLSDTVQYGSYFVDCLPSVFLYITMDLSLQGF